MSVSADPVNPPITQLYPSAQERLPATAHNPLLTRCLPATAASRLFLGICYWPGQSSRLSQPCRARVRDWWPTARGKGALVTRQPQHSVGMRWSPGMGGRFTDVGSAQGTPPSEAHGAGPFWESWVCRPGPRMSAVTLTACNAHSTEARCSGLLNTMCPLSSSPLGGQRTQRSEVTQVR